LWWGSFFPETQKKKSKGEGFFLGFGVAPVGTSDVENDVGGLREAAEKNDFKFLRLDKNERG